MSDLLKGLCCILSSEFQDDFFPSTDIVYAKVRWMFYFRRCKERRFRANDVEELVQHGRHLRMLVNERGDIVHLFVLYNIKVLLGVVPGHLGQTEFLVLGHNKLA